MSAILPSSRAIPNWFSRVFEREYFPGSEPYVAWLRQPVGWFGLATAASILVGVTIAPIALSLAAGLLSLLVIGLVYPWLAVRLTRCELVSPLHHLEEDEAHEVELRVRNGCPWPLWGLMIESFVVHPVDDLDEAEDTPSADIALSYVPVLSSAMYRLSIRPRLRGRYPLQAPRLTCSFPFGLWTARRNIDHVSPLVVHPKQIRLVGMLEQSGRSSHHSGEGSRSGGHGDFLGLRDYRSGDSIRHIHWAHTAKLGSLVVCERSAAEQSTWQISLSTINLQPSSRLSRENLAWRVRIAASLCTLLQQQSVTFVLNIEGEHQWQSKSSTPTVQSRLTQAIDRLTDVPLNGCERRAASSTSMSNAACCVAIEPVDESMDSNAATHALVRLRLQRCASHWRQTAVADEVIVDLDQPIAHQINVWLQRIGHGRHAA